MARAHARLHAPRWRRVRLLVFRRDKYRCTACGKAGRLECDHIIPLDVKPGQDPYLLAGLQTLCRNCHSVKTAGENKRPLTEGEEAWQEMVRELLP